MLTFFGEIIKKAGKSAGHAAAQRNSIKRSLAYGASTYCQTILSILVFRFFRETSPLADVFRASPRGMPWSHCKQSISERDALKPL